MKLNYIFLLSIYIFFIFILFHFISFASFLSFIFLSFILFLSYCSSNLVIIHNNDTSWWFLRWRGLLLFDFHRDVFGDDIDSTDCILQYSKLHDNLGNNNVSNAAYLKKKRAQKRKESDDANASCICLGFPTPRDLDISSLDQLRIKRIILQLIPLMDLICFSAKETDRLLQLHPSLRSRPYSSNLLSVTTCASYDQSDEIIHAIRLTDDSILRLSRQLYLGVRNFTLNPLFFFLPRLNKMYTLLAEGTDCSTYTYVDQMTAGQQ
jgi:hypothetical protein